MARKKKARIIILEGAWWKEHEVPQILPYFQALAVTHPDAIEISHRTFRNVDDIAFYVSQIEKDEGVMLYFACHGNEGVMEPSGNTRILPAELVQALGNAKSNAISFVHFGSCEMVHGRRRESHLAIMKASGATWVSGYTKEVDWLPSTFLDLMLVASIFVPQHGVVDGRSKRINHNANNFYGMYEQTIRQLGFSALSMSSTSERLYPPALR